MSRPIEEYALIGDLHSAALISRDGSIDWLCLPRFDSEACFAALLGNERSGHWQIAPDSEITRVSRRYLPDTLVLETEFSTASGTVRLRDCMPPRHGDPVLVRVIEGIRGRVSLRMTFAPRFEYGLTVPRVAKPGAGWRLTAGGHSLWLFSPLDVQAADGALLAQFQVAKGDRVPVAMVWRPSHRRAPAAPPASDLADRTADWWRTWVAGLSCGDDWRDAVVRSLITLKALSYPATGGLIAAPTTSLPMQASGMRNWDYRFCWIRDAAAGLEAFLSAGATDEASSLLAWLSHAVSGPARQAQPVYRVAGERRMPELELDWLVGYDGARPVRIGNGSAARRQLATFGYLLRARLAARAAGLPVTAAPADPDSILPFLEAHWAEPDTGIWEMRAPPRQFVHSKAMIWAAADSAIKMIERFGDQGPLDRWRQLRDAVRDDLLARGFDRERNTFIQRYGSPAVDASLLQLPLLGFLPADDPRMTGTTAAIARDLDDSGILLRYQPHPPADTDGLPPGQAGYLPGSFWLAQSLAAAGQAAQARRIFAALLELRNDVGLLAEGYDPLRRRFAGNYPLAGAHIGLVSAAAALGQAGQPARTALILGIPLDE
jgi:GH15 family glucan-1,4-alpha-glucosidase